MLHGRRTTRVQRGHHDLLSIELGQAQRQLGRGRRLARALQAGHQDDGGRRGVQIDRGRLLAAQHLDQAVIDDLDHLIGRLDRTDDVLARGALGGEGDEVLDDGQGDVGLEQRHADFAHRLGDVLFGQGAAPGDPVEDACQPLVQSLEHSQPRQPEGHLLPTGETVSIAKWPPATITSAEGSRHPRPVETGVVMVETRGSLASEAAAYGGKGGRRQGAGGSDRLVHHNEHNESTGNTTGPALRRRAQRLLIQGGMARSRRTHATVVSVVESLCSL